MTMMQLRGGNPRKKSSEDRERGEFDEFLRRIQQEKMRELWDNDADEAWNGA